MNNYFHQTANTVSENVLNIHTFSNYTHNLHFHKSFEVAYVTKANSPVVCTVGKKTYYMNQNDFVFVLPYEIHSFIIPEDTSLWIIVFSSDYVKKFSKIVSDMKGDTSRFKCSNSTLQYVSKQLIDPYPEYTQRATDVMNVKIKSCLYAICHEYLSSVTLTDKGKGYDTIIGSILNYISEHFNENISLKDVAKELMYNYQYLSRIFNQTMGVNFKTLVNHYRFEYAYQLLLETNKNISDIAFESGFQSIRSFNRIFFEISGTTPNAVRNNKL